MLLEREKINNNILQKKLLFSDQYRGRYFTVSAISPVRPDTDPKTASIIAMSTNHFKLEYCNSVYHVYRIVIKSPRHIPNSLACAVVKVPKICLVVSVLRSIYWIKINERVEYKLVSLSYKV